VPKRTISYRADLLDKLTDPNEAAHYLNAAMDDSLEMFLDALKDVAQAHQMAKVAREAGVARESLYRSLSSQGNPTIEMLHSVLKALKLRIEIASGTGKPKELNRKAKPLTKTSKRRAFVKAPVAQMSLFEEMANLAPVAEAMTLDFQVAYTAQGNIGSVPFAESQEINIPAFIAHFQNSSIGYTTVLQQ
jgi:probable addiction module antidote protein